MENKKNKEKKTLIKTKRKIDNSIEVTVQKSPAKTIGGKIFILIIVFGMSALMLVSLIWVMIELMSR